MNKLLSCILALFVLVIPTLNFCSETTNKETQTKQTSLSKELEVFHRPAVIFAILAASALGPVKTILMVGAYAIVVNRNEPAVKNCIETAGDIAHNTQIKIKQMWQNYKASTIKNIK